MIGSMTDSIGDIASIQSFGSSLVSSSSGGTDLEFSDDDLDISPIVMKIKSHLHFNEETDKIASMTEEFGISPNEKFKRTYLSFKNTSKGKVRICETVKIEQIPSREDEKGERWYSFTEIQQFEKEAYGLSREFQGNMSASNSIKANRKAVSFCGITSILSIPSMRDNYASIDSLWYSGSDIHFFENEVANEMRQFLLSDNRYIGLSYKELLNLWFENL